MKLIHLEDRCRLNESDSLELLNYKSGLVKDALNQIFRKSIFNDVAPMMGIIKNNASIHYFETDHTPNLNKKEVKKETLRPDKEIIQKKLKRHRVEYLTSAFKINRKIGSQDRIDWLNALNEAQNDEVFLSNVSLLVDFMWHQDYYWVCFDGIIHLIYAILLIGETTLFDDEKLSKYILIAVTAVLFTKEVYQICYLKLEYLFDIYNYMDFFGEIFYFIYAVRFLKTDG